MNRFVSHVPLVPALIVALFFGVTATHVTSADAEGSLTTVRVATPPIENAAEVYYAKDLGYFSQAGLDVEIDPIQSGSAVAEAVVSQAADIGFASIVPLAIAQSKQIPFVLVAPGPIWSRAARNTALFVTRNSAVRSAKDLNGRIVAIAGLGTLTEFATRNWIDQNGGDSSTVKFIELANAAMPAALDSGRIAAAEINEPYLEAAEAADRRLGYPNDSVAKEFLVAGWFTTASWAQAHPDVVTRFAAVMSKTAAWANQPRHDAEGAKILERYTKMTAKLLSKMVRVNYAERLNAQLVQPQITVTAKYAQFPSFPAQKLLLTPVSAAASPRP